MPQLPQLCSTCNVCFGPVPPHTPLTSPILACAVPCCVCPLTSSPAYFATPQTNRLSVPRSALTLAPPATSGTPYLCAGTRAGRNPLLGE